MENPFLMGKSTISMAIFNSNVSLPEGNRLFSTSGNLSNDVDVYYCLESNMFPWHLKDEGRIGPDHI